MKVEFLSKFLKDLDKIQKTKDKKLIIDSINLIKNIDSINELPSIKKLSGLDDAFRIRCGNYRIGFF